MTQVPNIVALAQQRSQAEAALQMEVRKVAMDIYSHMAAMYLYPWGAMVPDRQIDSGILREFARLAERAAPYLHQHYGALKINEEEHWKQ